MRLLALSTIDSYVCLGRLTHTGWRRLIGSPKLQIIFHKRATKCRSLLRKMTYKDKGSYESSPPCTCVWEDLLTCVYVCVTRPKAAVRATGLVTHT